MQKRILTDFKNLLKYVGFFLQILQESLAYAKISAWQQCTYEGF